MADCNNCSSYLSSEDIIRRSVKCSGGSVAFIGSLLNPEPEIPALNTSVLYNWDAIVDVRDIAPTGFNIATEEDWADLLGYVGGMADGGGKLKALLNWTEPNTGATDEYQFEAYPGGTRNADGTFADADYKAYFWIKNTNE